MPDCCIAILLGLVFCVIQPLMTPIALSYFLVNSILYKYQLIYVHKPQFESGGMVSYCPYCSTSYNKLLSIFIFGCYPSATQLSPFTTPVHFLPPPPFTFKCW